MYIISITVDDSDDEIIGVYSTKDKMLKALEPLSGALSKDENYYRYPNPKYPTMTETFTVTFLDLDAPPDFNWIFKHA